MATHPAQRTLASTVPVSTVFVSTVPISTVAVSTFATLAQTDPFEVISNFLASPLLKLALAAMAAFVVAVWLALAYRTYADAGERGGEPMIWGIAALVFPFAGALLYRIVRPREYADEREARRMQAALLAEDYEASRQGRAESGHSGSNPECPRCSHEMSPEDLFCAGCGWHRRSPCGSCGKALERLWSFCPACGHPRRPAPEGGPEAQTPRRRARVGGSRADGGRAGEGEREAGGG